MYTSARFIDEPFIDLLDPISVSLWMTRLSLTEAELRTVVRTEGGDARKVQDHIRRKKMFPKTSEN